MTKVSAEAASFGNYVVGENVGLHTEGPLPVPRAIAEPMARYEVERRVKH